MKSIKPAIESEKTILGAILLDSELLSPLSKILCPKDFYIYFHEQIFEAMIALFNKYKTVDSSMLIDALHMEDDHQQYLYMLANECPSTRNVLSHAEIVREKSVQKKLVEAVEEIKIIKKFKKDEYISQKEILSSFLEETAGKIRIADVNDVYLLSLLVEITKAFSGSLQVMKHE